MVANVTNSSCFELSNGFLSKKGITLSSKSFRRRTTSTYVWSFECRWFSRRDHSPGALCHVQDLDSSLVLTYSKLRHELPSASCARVPLDRHVKTSFSVYESGYVRLQPFLLIGRTCHIFTTLHPFPQRT